MIDMPDRRVDTDHDLLITLHTEVRGIRDDIKEIKDGTSLKLADHETRLRRLELVFGVGAALFIGLELYLKYSK